MIQQIKNLYKKSPLAILKNTNFLFLFISNIVLQLSTFGGQIFLTRILSVEDIGIIRILQSYLSIIAILALFGINSTILKLCSENPNEVDKNKVLVKKAIFISVVLNCLLLLFIYIFLLINPFNWTADFMLLLGVFLLQVPFLTFYSILQSFLHAQNLLSRLAYVQLTSKLTVLIISILAAYMFGLIGYIYGIVITVILTIVIYNNEINLMELIKTKVKATKIIDSSNFFKNSKLNFGNSVFWQIILSGGTVLATLILDTTTDSVNNLAYFGIAMVIISVLMMLQSTLNQVMIPKLSRKDKSDSEKLTIYRSYNRLAIVAALTISITSFVVVPKLLPLIFGSPYANAAPYFKGLIVAYFFWACYSHKNNYLFATGKLKKVFTLNLFTALVGLLTNGILIYVYGVMGIVYSLVLTFGFAYIANTISINQSFRNLQKGIN